MKISVEAKAPSNIALIKYMGKSVAAENRPTNSSLSWTLMGFETWVQLSWAAKDSEPSVKPNGVLSEQKAEFVMSDSPVSLGPQWQLPVLSERGRARFLKHAQFCFAELRARNFQLIPQVRAAMSETNGPLRIVIQSANSFPSDCGLASSASSFAALTCAVFALFDSSRLPEKEVGPTAVQSLLAALSQKGSGSSSRSLFSPWAIWKTDCSVQVPSGKLRDDLNHAVFIVTSKVKDVSSSEAHLRVATSSLFQGRAERAEVRLAELCLCLQESAGSSRWSEACDLVWSEMWDMHALFETSNPPFGYMDSGSLSVLRGIQEVEKKLGFRLMVTMDAGPNVHVLWPRALGADVLMNLKNLAEALEFNLMSQVGNLADSR